MNFLGTARTYGGNYCDPGLLRRALGSGACGKCSVGKQAWLKKSPTLESFDKDRLFNFIFLGMEEIFIKKNSKRRKDLFGETAHCRKLSVGGYSLQNMSIILRQVSILEKLALCYFFCQTVGSVLKDK